MSNESAAAEKIAEVTVESVTEEQVAAFLRHNPDFFLDHQELLAELSLPHQSGEAVSLLERQVSVLRERTYHANAKLGNLLENASKNDQLFELTRVLVLTLLRADSADQLAAAVCDTLSRQENIDACQLVVSDSLATEPTEHLGIDQNLAQTYDDVFRLQHTHCGQPDGKQLSLLFGKAAADIKSTARCPIMSDGVALGMLVIGSRQNNYFNVNLDTLFLDFVGHVIGAVLEGKLSR
jgi:uncharacterized protein YigA (DUF484 family)